MSNNCIVFYNIDGAQRVVKNYKESDILVNILAKLTSWPIQFHG